MSLDRDGLDWPNRSASRIVAAGGVQFHVQVAGSGPAVLLVHGTSASTHSWRDILPLLAARYTVIAPDLPGHAYSGPPEASDGMSLPGMAASIAALLDTLGARPVLAVGHSAGAAIVAQMRLDGRLPATEIASLNGMLLPFEGVPAHLWTPLARLFAGTPLVPWAFAQFVPAGLTASRVAEQTGSQLDAVGLDCYRRLAGNAAHVGAALKMMASWDLTDFERALPRLDAALTLAVGLADPMVPPPEARRVVERLPGATLEEYPDLGHLAHEEQPARFGALLARLAERAIKPPRR